MKTLQSWGDLAGPVVSVTHFLIEYIYIELIKSDKMQMLVKPKNLSLQSAQKSWE